MFGKTCIYNHILGAQSSFELHFIFCFLFGLEKVSLYVFSKIENMAVDYEGR